MILIDGSKLEGGGQILRMASSLCCILKENVEISNIRASRSKPGLKAQHLTGLSLLQNLCCAESEGLILDSTKVRFLPKKIGDGGKIFTADVQTAGSVALLIQSVLPCALFSQECTRFVLKGGTNVEMAPQIDYTKQVFRKMCMKFGVSFDLDIKCRGFFPAGKGEVTLNVSPARGPIQPVEMMERGDLISISGLSYAAGGVDIKISHLMANVAESILRAKFSCPVSVRRVRLSRSEAFGSGSGIVLWAETSGGCVIGSSSVGRRQTDPKETGASAAQEMLDVLSSDSCVDSFAQDQVIILMALATGKSRIRTMEPTLHTRTAIYVAELMTEAKFTLSEERDSGSWIIECDGIGYRR